ncbi:MAG: amidohydrolase family protein [Planctomycetota bacterium]
MLILSNIQKLYDGTAADESAVHAGVDLAIDGGRIASLAPHAPGARHAEADTVIDASDFTVTPGLVDCHGHITVLGLGSDAMDTMNSGSMLLYVEKILHTTLVDGGVTTMRDIGGATHLMKRMVDEGVLIGPRLRIAICMLSTTGGHADFRSTDRCHGEISKLWPEGPGRPSSVVDGPWEARTRVREIAACGADLIKVCASPGVASPSDQLEHREFTAEELRAITDEASARGLRVAAHAHSINGIDMAIANGVHDIQHISFMDEAQVERAFEAGCTVTPTSWVMAELLEADGLSPFVMDKVKKVNEVHQKAVAYAAAGGLKVLMGTDPVLPGMHGRNYMELVHLMRDGLSPLAVWHGSTGMAAAEIGQDDAGTLAPGQRADLLVAKGDVIEDPELFDRGALVEVFQDGCGFRGGLPDAPQRSFQTTVDECVHRRGGR